MLMVAIEQAALSRQDLPEHKRRHFTLLVDEWGSFAAQEKTISEILSQCRKFHLWLYLAAQSLSQVSTQRLSGALENCKLMIAFALGRTSAEIQAKQIGFADPFAIKEEPATHTQHSQYLSILDQFKSWNQKLMNLPTRCCYVKVHEKPAVKITSLKVQQPKVAEAERELAAVLGEYKKRYQRSRQEAEAMLQQEEARQALDGHVLSPEESSDTAAGSPVLFQNPFAQQDKEKQLR
jgi:hypothetical protein